MSPISSTEVGASILLPGRQEVTSVPPPPWAATHRPPRTRRVFAAPHVAGTQAGGIDWESTLAFRRHLASHGFGIAEAMDTAQRGMGLSWDLTKELIGRSSEQAARLGQQIVCGVGTDQLPDGALVTLAEVVAAYEEQLEVVQRHDSAVVLMCSRALAAVARHPNDYLAVYGHLIDSADRPVILHWLGDAFDPKLHGYWGAGNFADAAATVLDLVASRPDRVEGIKLSVLDGEKERALRSRLPAGVRMYTGDDFNYRELIGGDERGHSDALLGVFSAIAAPAAAALQALDAGDGETYVATMDPTVPLGRKLFEDPTMYYKTGIAFMAWLNGLQPSFRMLDHFENRRSVGHLVDVFELAASARALLDPELAVERMSGFLQSHGDR